jgi:hypothetical protein
MRRQAQPDDHDTAAYAGCSISTPDDASATSAATNAAVGKIDRSSGGRRYLP